MLTDETLKALIEAIIYVAPEPVSLDTILKTLEGEDRDRIKAQIETLTKEYDQPGHGIEVRQVAGGYRFSSKPEHHEVLRKFVKSLKPLIKLSKPALETLAVIAYRQPVTVPEIEEIRGVDCGGVIHTLLQKKLVSTAGRKNVVGRPILYRTSKEFLVHFGLKDTNELPSLKEFEELARQALGPDLQEEEEETASQAGSELQTVVAEEPGNTEPAASAQVDGSTGEDEGEPSATTAGEPAPGKADSPEEEAAITAPADPDDGGAGKETGLPDETRS